MAGRKESWGLAGVCLLIFACTSWAGQLPELQQHLEQAEADSNAGKYSEAAKELRLAIAIHPAIRGGYYQLGFALLQIRDLAGAEKAFTKELEFQPPDPYSLYYLGTIRSEAGQRDKAATFFERSLAAGEVMDVRQKLGSTYLALGRLGDAIRFLEVSVRLRPEDGGLHYLLGRACRQKGKIGEAKAEFDAAARWKAKFRNEMVLLSDLRQSLQSKEHVESFSKASELSRSKLSESGDTDILLASATALGQAGLHQEAIPFLKRAIAINPKIPEAHYDLARAYIATEKRGEAEPELEKSVELKPGFYQAELLLGTLLADDSKGEEAIKHLRAAAQIEADNPRLLMMLGLQYYQANYFGDAVETLKKAALLEPNNPDPWYLLIEAYYRNFQYEHALKLAEETEARFPGMALSHYHLGAQLNNLGRLPEAKQQLEAALAQDGKLTEAQAMLGEVLFKMGKPEDSLVCFRQALAIDPKLMNAQTGLGKALVQLKRYQEAASSMEEAIRIDSKLAPLHLYLSQAYRALGRKDEAKIEAEAFSRLNQERARARDGEGDRKYSH